MSHIALLHWQKELEEKIYFRKFLRIVWRMVILKLAENVVEEMDGEEEKYLFKGFGKIR
jgi:hypothetical protein